MAFDDQQQAIILQHANRLLSMREYPKTICPSEVARALSSSELSSLDVPDWRATMDPIRQILWEMRQAGEVEVLQKGEVVNAERLEDIRGPIRVRKAQT